MRQKKKNGFLLFCFSFLPGAGEMYLGFMKMGFSIMAVFAILICVVSFVACPELAVFPALFYVYSFFHAHNVYSLDDEHFNALEDEYLFGLDNISNIKEQASGKYRSWIAIICIVLGTLMLWNGALEVLADRIGYNNSIVKALYMISDYAPRFAIGVVIIIVGIRLIAGGKTEANVDTVDEKIEGK